MTALKDPPACPEGWHPWPTAKQLEAHGPRRGLWLGRPPVDELDSFQRDNPRKRLVLGTFDDDGNFEYESMGHEYALKSQDNGWLFCPVDLWGRTLVGRAPIEYGCPEHGGTRGAGCSLCGGRGEVPGWRDFVEAVQAASGQPLLDANQCLEWLLSFREVRHAG
jgi:hypothetical protein